MVVRTHVSLGGSIEGCCRFSIWQGRQTLSVPACSEVVVEGGTPTPLDIDVHGDENFNTLKYGVKTGMNMGMGHLRLKYAD